MIKVIRYSCSCGNLAEEEHPEDFVWNEMCLKCGRKQRRFSFGYREESKLKQKTVRCNIDAMHCNPRWSYSLGVHPGQIKEAMVVHPGAVFNEKGQMLISGRKEKLQRMKEARMSEYS